jgi:hypothetical protein
MSVNETVDILTAQTWPQMDKRDPLGLWGFRTSVAGDASGGNINLIARVEAGLAPAYVYAVYALTLAQLTGAITAQLVKIRLLTNWPNVDRQAGVQAYGSVRMVTASGSSGHTDELTGWLESAAGVDPLQRFLMLYDPRASTGVMDLIDFQLPTNVNPSTWAFEGWGYYWDRSVMEAPGGPRHPGSI